MLIIERRWIKLISLLQLSYGIINAKAVTVTTNSNVNDAGDKDDVIPITKLSIPLFAAHLSHHAYVYIGSPPQRRLVIVDTGSRILSFPCKPCQKCGRQHVSGSFWDPSVSTTDIYNDCNMERCVYRDIFKTCQRSRCIIQQAFTEGSSLTAYELTDLTWLGTENLSQSVGIHMHTGVPFTFGCLVSETGMISTQYADGILGLSMHSDNLITAMYKERSISSNAFSLCLSRVHGGFLSIGGIHAQHHHLKEPMHFEPLTESSGSVHHYYTIQIIAVRINSVALSLPRVVELFSAGKGTVVDSGTSDSYLPMGIAKVFREVWIKEGQVGGRPQTRAGGEHHHRAEMYTYGQFQRLPKVILTLSGGYDWEIPPTAYMEVVKSPSSRSTSRKDIVDDLVVGWAGEKKLINRIYLDEPNGCVLGANAMFGHDILFDITRKRIGLARADCKYHTE